MGYKGASPGSLRLDGPSLKLPYRGTSMHIALDEERLNKEQILTSINDSRSVFSLAMAAGRTCSPFLLQIAHYTDAQSSHKYLSQRKIC